MNLIRLKKRIRAHEGFREELYDDATGDTVVAPVGKITGGYGHNFEDVGISRRIAEFILSEDVFTAADDAEAIVPGFRSLSDLRQEVMVELAFWIGRVSLGRFVKMLGALRVRDFEKAADELLDSKLHREIPRRTEELASMLRTGGVPPGREERA